MYLDAKRTSGDMINVGQTGSRSDVSSLFFSHLLTLLSSSRLLRPSINTDCTVLRVKCSPTLLFASISSKRLLLRYRSIARFLPRCKKLRCICARDGSLTGCELDVTSLFDSIRLSMQSVGSVDLVTAVPSRSLIIMLRRFGGELLRNLRIIVKQRDSSERQFMAKSAGGICA